MAIAMRIWSGAELVVATTRVSPISADTFDITLSAQETQAIADAYEPGALYDVLASVPGGGINFVAKGPVEVSDEL